MILGAIAAIDEPLVSSTIQTLVANTLGSVASPTELPWEQAEVCLYAAFSCGEILSSIRGNKIGLGAHSYVQIPSEPGKAPARNVRQSLSVYQALPPNTLGEILQLLFRSRIGDHAHPVVQLQYFECVVRYASCFVLWPDLLPNALEAFLDQRGFVSAAFGHAPAAELLVLSLRSRHSHSYTVGDRATAAREHAACCERRATRSAARGRCACESDGKGIGIR